MQALMKIVEEKIQLSDHRVDTIGGWTLETSITLSINPVSMDWLFHGSWNLNVFNVRFNILCYI